MQDVWVRWQTTDRSLVRDAAAFLVTTTTRLAINVMQSARSRRETYVGPWLPEPVDTSTDPGLGAERGEALAFGVLVLLEKLTPTERAAYILREAFDYPYRDIANVLRLEEANARQVVTRARQHVAMAEGRPRVRPSKDVFSKRSSQRPSMATSPASKVSLRRTSIPLRGVLSRRNEPSRAGAVTTRLRIRSMVRRSEPLQIRTTRQAW